MSSRCASVNSSRAFTWPSPLLEHSPKLACQWGEPSFVVGLKHVQLVVHRVARRVAFIRLRGADSGGRLTCWRKSRPR